MNRNNNNIVSIEKTIHEEIINILSKNFSNKNYDNDFKTTLKIINDIIKEKTIEEKVKISNIYDFENLNENEYNYNIGENHKNHKNLLDKIKKTYIKYFENLYSLNINEFNDNIPNTLNIVFQINKIDSILFLPLYYEFNLIFISHFYNKKILELRKNKAKLYKEIPYLMYEQDVSKNNIDEKFIQWVSQTGLNKNPIINNYDSIFKNEYNDFPDKLENHHKNSFKFSTDYLKSPFDEDKIDYIYKNTIKILKLETNKNIKFLENKQSNENLIKAIIQENMLDFISENIYYEGFSSNIEFYKNKNKTIKKYENKKISKDLYSNVFSYIFNNSNNELEYKTLTEEYYTNIRNAISTSMILFYSDLFIYYQMLYYDLNQDLNHNIKLKELLKTYTKKYLNYIENNESKKELKQKLYSYNEDTEIEEMIKNYQTIIKKFKNNDFIFNFNEEELFILKFTEFYHYLNNNINNNNKFYLHNSNIVNINNRVKTIKEIKNKLESNKIDIKNEGNIELSM